ncbi:MAG: hypothetical protein RMK93_08185 [Bacteroidota bacterium]|nr:hypothetical protein [Bacteroidota bacterium]
MWAQPHIGLLTIEYEPPAIPPPWWAPLCHCPSKLPTPEFIARLLTLAEGDRLDPARLTEERIRLQSSGVFAHVSHLLDTLTPTSVELRWIVSPRCLNVLVPIASLSRQAHHVGALLHTVSLWQPGDVLSAQLWYRQELGIGWETALRFYLPLSSLGNIEGAIRHHRYRTAYQLSIGSPPPHQPLQRWNGGIEWCQETGKFWDLRTSAPSLYTRRDCSLQTWLAWKTQRYDQLFITLLGQWQYASSPPGYRKAFDNTALLLLGVGSLAHRYQRLSSPLLQSDSCTVITGAWGAVICGLGFPSPHGGERFTYLAGELEQSVARKHLLLSGRIAAGNAFAQRAARYTVLETALAGWLSLAPPLLLAWNGRHQNVWNWDAYRAERLDALTGFPTLFPSTATDNRLELRTELRWRGNPITPEIGWTALFFHHIGTLWNQGTQLSNAHFRNATGFGFWLHVGGTQTLRWSLKPEIAYTHTLRRFLPLLHTELTTDVEHLHRYRLPRLLGAPLTEEP